MTNFAVADGVTVHALPSVYTALGQAVCEAMILRCPTAVLFVRSATTRIWKFLYSFARSVASPPVACPVILDAPMAVAESASLPILPLASY